MVRRAIWAMDLVLVVHNLMTNLSCESHVNTAFHLKIKPIKCKMCKIHSCKKSLGPLRYSYKVNDESNVCYHCGKSFKSRWGLQDHAYLHDGSCPYLFIRRFARSGYSNQKRRRRKRFFVPFVGTKCSPQCFCAVRLHKMFASVFLCHSLTQNVRLSVFVPFACTKCSPQCFCAIHWHKMFASVFLCHSLAQNVRLSV